MADAMPGLPSESVKYTMSNFYAYAVALFFKLDQFADVPVSPLPLIPELRRSAECWTSRSTHMHLGGKEQKRAEDLDYDD